MIRDFRIRDDGLPGNKKGTGSENIDYNHNLFAYEYTRRNLDKLEGVLVRVPCMLV